MMNCVLTHASTVTRCATTARRVRSTSNLAASTVGHPSTPGEKCAVHRPKPKGAGTAPKKTSSEVSAPASAANWWK